MSQHYATIIIGAGISGISAAIDLLEHGIDDLAIFEAQNRIGGRVNTIDYGNGFIELGAQYIHGQLNNPIFNLARDCHLIEDCYHEIARSGYADLNGIDIQFANEDSDTQGQHFRTQRGEHFTAQFAEQIYTLLNKAIRRVRIGNTEQVSEDNNDTDDMPVGQYFYKVFWELINEAFNSNGQSEHLKHVFTNSRTVSSQEFKDIIDGFFLWRCKCENVERGCENIFGISLRHLGSFVEYEGSQAIEILEGYRSVIENLIGKHEAIFKSKLHLKHKLDTILLCQKLNGTGDVECKHCEYTNEPNKLVVIVQSVDSAERRIFTCDRVLCTMSLGYLKHHIETLIEPSRFIPNEKLRAIARLGYGTVNKIFLVYDKPFWTSNNFGGLQPIWTAEHKIEADLASMTHQTLVNRKWYEGICSIELVANQPSMLVCWISGNATFESLDDETISADLTQLLRQFMNDEQIPEPSAVLRSFWGSNDYFRGSYSHVPLGATADDYDTVSRPISISNHDYILFAGEATSRSKYSTVHGAFESGKRESERIRHSLQ